MVDPIRIVIVDEHELMRYGFRYILQEHPELKLVGEATDQNSAISIISDVSPDIVLLNLNLPNWEAIEILTKAKPLVSSTKYIVLTDTADVYHVRKAFQAGADGFLLKKIKRKEIVEAIIAAYEGGMPIDAYAASLFREFGLFRKGRNNQVLLNDCELEIIQAVANGEGDRQIALTMNLSHGTIRNYVSRIMKKLDAGNRTEAAMKAIDLGLIQRK